MADNMPNIRIPIRNGIINKIIVEIEVDDHIEVVTLTEIAPECGMVFRTAKGEGVEKAKFTISGHAMFYSVEEKELPR